MSEEKWYVIGDTKKIRCDGTDYIAIRNPESLSEDYYTQDFVTALNLKIDMLLIEVDRLKTQQEIIKATSKSGKHLEALLMIEEM